MEYITEKHQHLVEYLHHELYNTDIKWTYDAAIAEHPVLFLGERQGAYYACVKFDGDLDHPQLVVESPPNTLFQEYAENKYQEVMGKIDLFLGTRGKWRAVGEHWRGETEDTYRAILFKDDQRDKFFLHQTVAEQEFTAELSHVRAMKWIQHYDEEHWPEARMRKEFAKPVVDFLIKEQPGKGMPSMDQVSRQILFGKGSNGTEQADIEVTTLLKDKYGSRFWLGTAQYKNDALDVNGEGQYMLIGSDSEQLSFKQLSDQQAFDWLISNDGVGWNQNRLSDYFPVPMVEAATSKQIIEAPQIDPKELLQIDKGWTQVGQSVEGEPESYTIEKLFKSPDNRFFTSLSRLGSDYEHTAIKPHGFVSLFPADNTDTVEELSEQRAFDWVVDLDLAGWSPDGLKRYFSAHLVDALEASYETDRQLRENRDEDRSVRQEQVASEPVTKEANESTSILDAIKKIADKFNLKLLSAFTDKSSTGGEEQRKDMKL